MATFTNFRCHKFLRHVWRLLKIFAVLMVVSVLVMPVRNTIFMSIMPYCWKGYETSLLIKMIFDTQNFPTEAIPIGKSPVHIPVDFNDIQNKFMVKNIYPEFTKQKQLLQTKVYSDPKAQNLLDILSFFDPKVNDEEYALMMFTFDTFIRACEKADLTYFLLSGTLMGALRHHGFVPWDDDFDIAVKASEWEKLRNVLSNIDGFELYAPPDSQWKFFIKDRPASNKPFKWPNIDIFFYGEDDTYIWSVTWGMKPSMLYRTTDVYPLYKRTFDRWTVFVPRDPHLIVSMEYGTEYMSVCATANYQHKSNTVLSDAQVASISCQVVHPYMPFVFAHPGHAPGTVREELRIGRQSLNNYTVPVWQSKL